ncbi:hypothetical protein NE237_017836 [Protea cynaroides]|uniref:Uncharacterized protein n=1 Tax=Protea cynaroides TaxID=273540 RepID=A0A9Q0K8T2_9MAGN|nr:hypothetical protein NE237_017836 [Protea cynaroides]
MFVSQSGTATSKFRDNFELERESVDLGKILGFPSLDAGRTKEGRESSDVANKNGSFVNKRTRNGSKHQRWVAHKKGKNVMEGSNHPNGGADSVSNANGVWETIPHADSPTVMAGVNGSNNPSGATRSGRSFASVLFGLLDLSNLPEPVTEGGLTRVVIPQVIYERQLEKEGCPIDMRVPPVFDIPRHPEEWSRVHNSVVPLSVAGNKSNLGPWPDVEDEVHLDNLEDGEVRTPVMDFDDHVSVPQCVDVNVSAPQHVDVTIVAWPVNENTKEVRPDQGTKKGAFLGNGVVDGDFTGSAIEIRTGMGLEGGFYCFFFFG